MNLDDLKNGDKKLMSHIARLGEIRLNNLAVQSGKYSKIELKNQTFLFMREHADTQIYVALNISDNDYAFNFKTKYKKLVDLLSGREFIVLNETAVVNIPKNCSCVLEGEN